MGNCLKKCKTVLRKIVHCNTFCGGLMHYHFVEFSEVQWKTYYLKKKTTNYLLVKYNLML